MVLLVAEEISKRLFICVVCAIAIIPRQHIDRTRWSIGGGPISYSFRKLLLVTAVLNMIRFLCKLIPGIPNIIGQILGVIQILGLTFLCFVTPYILQTHLITRINLPGGGRKPGANLMIPFYITGILSLSGVLLTKYYNNPRFWSFNRFGNVISVPPVLQTLNLYNSITSVGGHHAGRGNILCQTLYVIEVWHMVTQFLVAIAYLILDPSIPISEYGIWETILYGCRDIAFTSGWTRIIGHAIFINLLDELTLTSTTSTTNNSAAAREGGGVRGGGGGNNNSSPGPGSTDHSMEMQALVLHKM